MSEQSIPFHHGTADAGGQVAQLRQVLALVDEMANGVGGGGGGGGDHALDEAARISAAYDLALPVVQRRFDMHAAQTASWAAAGVSALLVLTERGRPIGPAAARLAAELRKALAELGDMVSARSAGLRRQPRSGPEAGFVR